MECQVRPRLSRTNLLLGLKVATRRGVDDASPLPLNRLEEIENKDAVPRSIGGSPQMPSV